MILTGVMWKFLVVMDAGKGSEMLGRFEFDPIGGEWGPLQKEQETSRCGGKKMMILFCPC